MTHTKRALLLFILLPACGGTFSEAIPDARETVESSTPETRSPEAGTESGTDTGPEAMSLNESSSDGSTDSSDSTTEAAPPDTGTDTGPCLPPSSYNYKIFSGGSTFIGYTSPAECQCAATYTCACLLAAPDICTASFGSPTGCTVGVVLTVDCSP